MWIVGPRLPPVQCQLVGPASALLVVPDRSRARSRHVGDSFIACGAWANIVGHPRSLWTLAWPCSSSHVTRRRRSACAIALSKGSIRSTAARGSGDASTTFARSMRASTSERRYTTSRPRRNASIAPDLWARSKARVSTPSARACARVTKTSLLGGSFGRALFVPIRSRTMSAMRCANGSSSEARGGGSSHAADHASGADLCNRGFPCCYRFAEQIGLRSRRLGENRHPAQRTECNRPSELKARQPLGRAHFVGAHADWRRQARLVIELFVLILTAAMNLEDRIRTLMTGGDLRGAATATIEGYGPEIFGYLLAVLRDEADASDAYGQTCEDRWQASRRSKVGRPFVPGSVRLRTGTRACRGHPTASAIVAWASRK